MAAFDCSAGVQEAVQGQGRCGLGEARRNGPEEGCVDLQPWVAWTLNVDNLRAGKYQWIEKSYGDDEDEEEDGANVAGSSKKPEEEEKIPDSTLGPELQQLVKLIFNQS